MNPTDYLNNRRKTLEDRIDSVRQSLRDPTLTDMERDRLHLVWDRALEDLDDLERHWSEEEDLDWRDAREVIDGLPTPPPASPIRFAPSPPPHIVLGRDVPLPPLPPVARSVSSHGWPPPSLSSTHLLGLHPIEIPEGPIETAAPPPPRPWEPSEEDIERANAWEDDRDGCAHCPGCHYCTGYGYDGNDEV